MEKDIISHRQRMENCLSGAVPDRTPIALWRHFPVDDQTPDDLAKSIIGFQNIFDFDLVKVTPASSYCLKDWGVEDEWQGNPEGTRQYTRRVIHSPDDWAKLPVLDPYNGSLGNQLTCLKLIIDTLGPDVPVIQTIFNPLSQAKNLVGNELLLVHLRQYPEALAMGLKTIADSTCRFIDAAKHTGIAGIFFAVQHANYQLLSETEYLRYGKTFDLEILEMVKEQWLNMLHLHGENIMFNLFTDYPVQVLNWHDRETYPSLVEAKVKFPGIVCGGLRRQETMELGTPKRVFSEARDAVLATGNHRFILGTGCVLQTTTPAVNIKAALQAARNE